MRVFAFDGPFFRVMGRVFDLVLLQVLWVVCSLPLVTIGASTTALYTVTLKMVKNEESYIARSYFRAFKDNFIQATKLWLMMAAAAAWFIVMIRVCIFSGNELLKLLGIAQAALFVLFVLTAQLVFPIQATYENAVRNILKNACICAMRYLPYSIGMLGVVFVPVIVTGFVPQVFPAMIAFWIFVGSSAIALADSWLVQKIFGKV